LIQNFRKILLLLGCLNIIYAAIQDQRLTAMHQRNNSRRKLIKSVLGVGGAIVTASQLPRQWTRPIVESVLLPAHAQMSQTCPLVVFDSTIQISEPLECDNSPVSPYFVLDDINFPCPSFVRSASEPPSGGYLSVEVDLLATFVHVYVGGYVSGSPTFTSDQATVSCAGAITTPGTGATITFTSLGNTLYQGTLVVVPITNGARFYINFSPV
jgi:hypothetical protein